MSNFTVSVILMLRTIVRTFVLKTLCMADFTSNTRCSNPCCTRNERTTVEKLPNRNERNYLKISPVS
ncbi:hypothetical protein, partial [Wolbachia endosymbiont of Mansonella perstans]|uniref:hypothetical protein n=1 Tax=Wolbachia endosymbiont of Mansonella perstans TaxID=229526 RepID=UPI001CE1E900